MPALYVYTSPNYPLTHPTPLPLSPLHPTAPSPPHSASLSSQGLCQALKDYLREQGVTPDVLADLLEFYSAFEQQCYTDEFLKGVRAFLDTKN